MGQSRKSNLSLRNRCVSHTNLKSLIGRVGNTGRLGEEKDCGVQGVWGGRGAYLRGPTRHHGLILQTPWLWRLLGPNFTPLWQYFSAQILSK